MLNFRISRLSSSLPFWARTQLGFLHIFNSFSSVAKLSESNQQQTQKHVENEPFTVSYLVNSLGMSPKVAIEVSKRIQLKGPNNPDSVLILLRSYGFSETHLCKLVEKFPKVILANPEKTLLPKLRFFQSIGFSGSALPELFISKNVFLYRSLEKWTIPYYEALKSVLEDDEQVYLVIKRCNFQFFTLGSTNLIQNINVLREEGVPQSTLSFLLTSYPTTAFLNHAKFVKFVKFAKEAGLKPCKTTFIQAIMVLSQLKKSTWESKLDMFERCGWSRDATLSAFSKYPPCMLLSEEKMTKLMKFLVDETGFPLEGIAGCPTILAYSLKQRIIPRWSVVKILRMKGLLKNNFSVPYLIIMSEKKFVEKFVIGFQESVPHLLEIYRAESTPPKKR